MTDEVYQAALQRLAHHKGSDVFFVVIGAMDGVAFDPLLSRYIKEFSWSGVFIEPLPDLCEELRRNYSAHPNVTVERLAITDFQGRRKFWRTPRSLALDGTLPRWTEGIGSLHNDRNALSFESIRPFVVETDVECDTLAHVFEKHGVKKVDLIQIDTEGHDWIVLSQFNILRYLPSVICVEMNLLPEQEKHAVRRRILASGYTWVEDLDLIASIPENREIQIPKLFHRIWLGPKTMPSEYIAYGESWLKCHPGWEMKLWTDDNLPPLINSSIFDRAAHACQKADIARYELIYRFGGVYLDTDFECLRSIEPILPGVKAFSASEDGAIVSIGILGAVAKHPLFLDLIQTLPERFDPMIPPNESTGPGLMTEVARRHPELRVFCPEFFYPIRFEDRETKSGETSEAFAVHHWAYSWKQPG